MDDKSDLARRQAALRALAQSQTQQPADAGVATPPASSPAKTAKTAQAAKPSALAALTSARPPSARRRFIAGGATLAVVAIIAAVVVANVMVRQRATTAAPKTVLRINAIGDGLHCVTSVAWSPNGKQVAALGNTQGCVGSASDSQSGAVFVYDAQTGKVVQQLQPDTLVFKSPVVEKLLSLNPSSNSAATSLNYQAMIWAPDGQSLLLPFYMFLPQPSGPNAGTAGLVNGLLLLATAHSASSQVWLSSNTSYPNDTLLRWDLTTSADAFVPAPPTATAYRWNSDGTLSAVGLAAGQPIGTPDGGQTFSIWQPGNLQYFQSYQSSPTPQEILDAHDILWNANAPTVSPDGHYLYTYFPSYGSLVPPSTKQDVAQQPRLTPRDPALLALAQQMMQATSPSQNTQILAAWRPDGRLLAEISVNANPNQDQNASGAPPPSAFTVSLYDTTTGTLIKRLTPNFAGLQVDEAGNGALAWSPDGKRLLLADNIYGAITIWGPGALPA